MFVSLGIYLRVGALNGGYFTFVTKKCLIKEVAPIIYAEINFLTTAEISGSSPEADIGPPLPALIAASE